jgi:effector-binding domain-containing protein
MNTPEVVRRERQFALAIRVQTAADQLGEVLNRCLAHLCEYAEGLGMLVSGAPFTRYIGFSESRLLDVEIGIPTLDPAPGDGVVESVELPGGECVTLLHVGPYELLLETHMQLDEWFEQSGRKPAGYRWETYLSGADDERHRALLTQPVEPL